MQDLGSQALRGWRFKSDSGHSIRQKPTKKVGFLSREFRPAIHPPDLLNPSTTMKIGRNVHLTHFGKLQDTEIILMKKTPALIAAIAALSCSNLALAGTDSGFYIGGSLGSANAEYDDNTSNFDDSDTGYKVLAGYNMGLVPFLDLAVEGSYYDFGTQSGKIATLNADIDSTGWSAFFLAGMDLGIVGVFAKVGALAWDADLSVANISDSNSGTDPAFGLGAKIQLGSLAVRAEWEQFQMDDLDMDYYSVGAVFTF